MEGEAECRVEAVLVLVGEGGSKGTGNGEAGADTKEWVEAVLVGIDGGTRKGWIGAGNGEAEGEEELVEDVLLEVDGGK